MANLTLRGVKGSPLTNQEVDDNFSNLNTAKYESGDSATFTDVTLDGMAAPIAWNSGEGTIDVPLNADVTLQVGQEEVIYCKAGEALANGDVVYASGAVGASGAIEVSKYTANNSVDEIYVLGVATQAIANGEFGYITVFGKVRGLATNGTAQEETWVDGTVLYASATTAGGLTNVKPTEPNQAITVAMVVASHATNGTLFVRPTAGFHLGELHDVKIASAAQGNLLAWNSSGYWENTNTIDNDITVTGNITGNIRNGVATPTVGATTTLDFDNNNFIVTLTQDTTFSPSNLATNIGATGTIVVLEDATGGWTFTIPSTFKTPRGETIIQHTTAGSANAINYFVVDANTVLINYIGDFR